MRYLCSYKPLIAKHQGRTAISTFRLPPYVDGSCRREPDFESAFPSITALCRFKLFAPHLQEGDTVVYITRKGRYEIPEDHWRLVAILKILERFENHKDAAGWYASHGFPLPCNCLVQGNAPVPLERTTGDKDSLERWDAGYQWRARKCGVFLVCKAKFLELQNPPILTRGKMLNIFGKIPYTMNPPKISDEEYKSLGFIQK